MTGPPPLDVERRRPVWVALSEFWLDTEMSSATAHGVVRAVLESPYSVDQAEAIHWHEVAPALRHNVFPNLFGEWAGFDEGWLVAACAEAAARRPPGWVRSLRARWLRRVEGGLATVVFDRARRAEREGLPPRPTGPFVSLVVSRRPLRYRVPW